MDFSALIAELRNIASSYNGRDIDSNVSTAMYCEMFRKILQKAESEVAAYDDQIVILWMTLSQLCQTYKTLTKCKERNDLYQHIFLLCAKVVLNIKWQQLADDDQSKENFRKTVEATHSQLVHAGFDRFGLLLNIMENPWTDPTITKIMSGDVEEESNSDTEEDENEMSDERKKELEERKKKKTQERDEEFTKYIGSADPLILRLRVEMLMQENCEEWALNLCNCCLKQRRYQMDLEFKTMQLLLLFKLGSMEKLQEVCETIECHHGIYIIEKLEKKESNQSLCVRLIQIFLVQDWIRPDRNCCTKKLLQMWIKYQSMEDKDRDKFLDSVWAIAKISSSTDQVNQLVTGLVKKCGLNLLQLYTDLCVYAINFDKGCCEQQMIQGNMEGVKKQQWAISVTCIKLADLYCNCNPKLARIAALTAFSLNPTIQNFNVVRKTFTDKRKEKMQAVKQDLSEEKGKETPQKEYKPRQSKYLQKVNPATIHEVERLLNMLRPYYLDPELGFEKLQPVCQKFMDERGGGISEPPKKPNRPPTKTNSNSPRQNTDVQYGSDNSAGSSRSNCAPTKSKNPPITAQPAPSPASSLAKSPLFGNKPRSYRAMSQPETVSKPQKTVQSNANAQRLVPLIQPSPTPQTKTTSVDSTSNISELLKATKTLPQYNPNGSPATSLSYTSPSFVSVPQRMSGVNTQLQSTDLLRRKSVNLPVSTGGAFSRSEIIGDTGDKSIYHHLYKPLKPQEPTSLKTAKPPSNKLQVTNVNNKFQGHPNSYSVGGQANFQSTAFNSIARPADGASFAPPAAGVDSRRPSAEELQSIVDWLQSGTEDAISKQNNASFNAAIQQTPPPAHTPQPSYAARGQAVHNSQAHSSLQSVQKVDLNTLLTKPQVVANVLKIQPKGKTAVQEAASQISQRLSDIRSQGDVQLLFNLQKKYGSHQKPVAPTSAPNSDQPVPKKSVNDTKGKKNLTDTDLSLEEMKRRIADIVQKQKLLCENKPDQPAKRRRSDSPKGKKKTTGSSSSTPTKGLKPASSPAVVATATSDSSNTPPQGEVQKQQIKEWFNNRLQVQQQIEKIKQQPPSISSLSKPQFILQQQAAPVHFVSASQIENLRSSSVQKGAGNPRASEGPSLHRSPGPPQKKVDHYDQRLGLLSNSASTKPSLLEQKLLQDDSATTASLQDSSMLSSSLGTQTPNLHQLRTFQASAQNISNEGVLPSQLQLPLPNSQVNTGVSQGSGISEGTLPSSDGPTPTTLLSVLLEQSKYITSVAATSASNSPSQSKNFQGVSSQVNTNTWSHSTLSNPVLSSLACTPTSAPPIRTSAQQTLSILLPKTAHCGKQDVENSNSDSTSTSSTVDSREIPKDSSLMSPVGYQLKYVGQIKTKDIQSVAKSGNDLLGGNTSGQSIKTSPSRMKLLTCFDNEVVKEISKMIGVEKKQAMPPVEIPIISKPQQQIENVDNVHCVSVKNNTENSFVTENKQMGGKEVSRLESLGAVLNEKPTPSTDLKATSEQSHVGVKNYRQSLIDSLENGIKQSMEHIDVSAELLEKSSQNILTSCIDLDLTREKVSECSESVGDISSTAQPVLPNVQVVQEESTEKLPESQTCMGKMIERGADSGPKISLESQTSTDKTIELGANSDRNSSSLSPAAQPSTQVDHVDPLVYESGSKPEEEWSQEKCLDDVADIEVNQSDTSNLSSEKDSANKKTLSSVPDEVNSKSISEEQPKEAAKEEKSSEKTDNNIPDIGRSTLESKEEDMLPEVADEMSELKENALAEAHKEEEMDKAEETVKDVDHTEETEKPKLSNPNISVDSAISEETQQRLVMEDSESAGMEDQQMEEESLVEETENNEPSTDTAEIEKDEAKEKDFKVEQTEMLCMEDIKLDNIDRSKVIHKLKNDMNNLLHQIEDLNGSHGSRSIAETLSEMNCHEQPSENQNVQISKLSETVQKMEEELEEERKREQEVRDQGSVVTTKPVPLELAGESSEESEEAVAIEETKARKNEVEETESMSTEFEKEVTPDEKLEEMDLTSHENQEKLEVKSDEKQVIGEFASEESKVEIESQSAEDRSTDQREGENNVECKGKKVEKEEKDKGSEKITDEEKEIMAEEGNRKLDKFRKNQKNKKTDIPVNFGFDFNEESHGDEIKINKTSSSEDSNSRESEFVKVSPPEPKHKRLQGSAILKTKKKYRENLKGAKEVAEKIKEHIISGTKVVEITEKTALPSVIETKAFSADVKKNMPAGARVNDPDFDKHSIASNSSSCSSVPSINQMQTIQSNPEKEKGMKEIPEKTNNCLICGKEFRSVMSLKEHVKNKCKSTDYVRTKDYEFSSRFTCCKCGMTSSSPYDMKKHLKKQHNMIDDKDFEDLLISSYKCELCGEMFKDKTSIYSHVSTSCPYLGARRKESKLFSDDKCAVKTVPNLVNPNRGKLSSATTNQSPPNNVGFKEKVPVAKAEIQRQPKTVSRELKATEVTTVKSENTKILSQEKVFSPVETAIGKSQIEEKNSGENASLSIQEESQTDSKKKTEPQVSNQRVTRSRLENTSTKKESGTNNVKGMKQQVVAEKSGKKVGEDPMKEDNHVEDSCRKLSFDESRNKASVEEEKSPEKSNKKDRSTERKKANKESPELKTPTARSQSRGKNGRFTPRSSAVPSNEKKEDNSTDLSNQDKSQTSKPTYRRHTRSKGTVENVDLSDLEKVEMNFRKSRSRQHSGSTDVSLVSECSEIDQQQKSSEQTKRKKLNNDSCEVKSTSSAAVAAESGQDASSSQRKRKESSSVQPPVETLSRGKRLIKVKKFDQFEVPEFLKSQVINSNLKRQVKVEKVPDKVIQTPAKNETKKEIRKCSRCSKQFANQTKLIKHIATVHLSPCKPSSSSRMQKCSYQCRYCKATYKTYLQFLNHVPGHATQILEGLDSKQIVPAVVHSKPANVKDTEDSGPQKEETENIIKKEEAEENEVKTRSTRQSENKAKPVKEPTENAVATRSRRSTASSENGQGDKANQKAKSSSTSKMEKQVLTSRSRSRSGRGLDNKEEKPEVHFNSPSRQLRSKRDSRGNEKDNDVLKKKQNLQQNNQNTKAQEKQLPQTEEHMTRSSAKRKSESNKSPAPSKKSKTDQPDSAECETSEFELAGSDAEISFRKRMPKKRKVEVNFVDTCGSDIEEMPEETTEDDDDDYNPAEDEEEEEEDEAIKDDLDNKPSKTIDSCSKKQDTGENNTSNNHKGLEKVPVAVVDDDEFEYVKSPSHETTFNEASKAPLHKASEVKEKIVLSRSSKDHTAYLNSFKSYIDNRSKKTKEEKEKVAKTLQQPNKKTVPNKKARLDTDRDNSTDTEERGATSGTPNQAPTSFLDSFLEHCSKATDGEMSSPSGSVKGEDTKAGEDHVATKAEQKEVNESKPDAEIKERTECVIGNVDSKVTEAGDKTSFNAFQDTFKSFVTAGSKKGSLSGEGNSSTQKESLTDVIEGLRDSERTHRAGSEESVQTVSSRCTDISDTSEGAQGSTASKSKRMRHIYHNGKIWHVGAGNVTSMSVKQNDPEGHPLPSSTLTNPSTPGMTLATKQLIKVDRDKNTPHQDQSENTYTYTTAEELKKGTQGGSTKWRVKRDKTQLSFRK